MRANLVGLGLVLAAACNRRLPDSEVAARVNDQPITRKEFDETAERNLNRYRNQGHQLQPNIEARIRESVLRRMIEDKIIELKSKEQQIAVTDEELNTKFNEQKTRFRTEEAFKDYLTRSQNTEAQMKEELRRNMLRDRLVEKLSGEVTVTDDEIKKFYDDNINRFKDREQVKVSRIVVRLAPNATEAERKKAKAKAQGLAKDAKKPNADFAKLARDNSNGPEAATGGDLGMLFKGRMPPEFDAVAFAMKPGEVSDPVETKLGYEIIRVEERKDERTRPIEEVTDTIRTSLLARKRNDKRREILRDLKANAKVEQILKFDVPAGAPPSETDPQAGRLPGPPGMPNMPPPNPEADAQAKATPTPPPAQPSPQQPTATP
jgi:peptidyl-prolyl cis-trans isomerase C